MFIETTHLTTEQFKALEILLAQCKIQDGHCIPVYPHLITQKRPHPYSILYYDKTHLAGFITAFFFYESACELVLMVSPSHRRRGIATALLSRLLPKIKNHQTIQKIYIPTPQGINDVWLKQQGFHRLYGEYKMQRTSRQPIFIKQAVLHVRQASYTDIPFLCAVDALCFPNQQTQTPIAFKALLHDLRYRIMLASLGHECIGKAHIHQQMQETKLSDIAILPGRRGRGFGYELTAYCINDSLKRGDFNLTLEVEDNHIIAHRLYAKLGFSIINACNYWTIALTSFNIAC